MGAGRRDVARERKRRGTLYETVKTRGSGTREGLEPTGGKEEGTGYEGDAAEKKEKRRVVRVDAIRVGRSYTRCPSRSLATI